MLWCSTALEKLDDDHATATPNFRITLASLNSPLAGSPLG
jgi:hypothetical protein